MFRERVPLILALILTTFEGGSTYPLEFQTPGLWEPTAFGR
jgi:hypothetical protein